MFPLIAEDNLIKTTSKNTLIAVENISKKFCRNLKLSLFYGIQDIATELIAKKRNSERLRHQEFWALHNINFQLKPGEAIGLIGENGAGKSTLLRLISGLIKPDTGSIKVRGRIAPLIALGAGFNPILSGRENIYANMSILGLSTREINEKIENVIDFAEIEDAIDAPVQTYSSGMAARLGFACAVHIKPDVLLIDEVLAVGDIKFRMKCYKKLAQLREEGTAFILVAHNPHVILNVCESSIYLAKGELITYGNTVDVIRKYEEDLCMVNVDTSSPIIHLPAKAESASMGIDITSLCLKNDRNEIIPALFCSQPASLSITCKVNQKLDNANIGILINALSGESDRILYITSASDDESLQIFPGKVEIQMQMPYCCLLPGLYNAKIYIKQGVQSLDIVQSFRFVVKSDKVISQSLFYQPRTWKVINQES
ncbi:ABC transporter ATP-binding protein [Calothrix sp. UHCC 0171]|uniref:ABC transporter ATP-binding protein n=1 Tax=Calothrix sp. UHCC 0171 TaxID=3110245 RepID=UPI002B1FEAC9|nr:ABC transporter ATP-binding protein [Calothrix sp. UHCC 0171]MEA5572775.1 ABC transporter ATP-binding protein [Calothrix sp. UHCC 0171]